MPKNANGEGSIRKRPDGKYEARLSYEDPITGVVKRQSFYGRTSAEVRQKLREGRGRVEAGSPVKDATRSVGDWCAHWCDTTLAASDRADSTKDNYKTLLTTHVIKQPIGEIPLGRLRPSDLDRWKLDMRARGKADGTTRKVFRTLRVALEGAVRDTLIARNPLDVVEFDTQDTSEAQSLEVEELRRLLAATAGTRSSRLLTLLAWTGMRKGEALALKWTSYNTKLAVLQIRATLARRKGVLVTSRPKTVKSRRDVDVSTELAVLLKAQRVAQTEDRLKAGGEWEDTGFIFTTETGQPIDPRNVLRSIKAAAKKAGLPDTITVHTLRHTFATQAAENGVNGVALSEILGHADTRFTDRVYVHPRNEAKRQAMGQIAQMFS